jgi:hypothetical protein
MGEAGVWLVTPSSLGTKSSDAGRYSRLQITFHQNDLREGMGISSPEGLQEGRTGRKRFSDACLQARKMGVG